MTIEVSADPHEGELETCERRTELLEKLLDRRIILQN